MARFTEKKIFIYCYVTRTVLLLWCFTVLRKERFEHTLWVDEQVPDLSFV